METSYIEGLATHGGLESCVGVREDAGEALNDLRVVINVDQRTFATSDHLLPRPILLHCIIVAPWPA